MGVNGRQWSPKSGLSGAHGLKGNGGRLAHPYLVVGSLQHYAPCFCQPARLAHRWSAVICADTELFTHEVQLGYWWRTLTYRSGHHKSAVLVSTSASCPCSCFTRYLRMAVTVSRNAAIAASLKAGACCCFLYTAVASKCPTCNSVSSSLEDRPPKASVVPIKESDHEEPEHRSTDEHLENGWQVESTIEKPRAAFSLSLDMILGRNDSTTPVNNNQCPMSESDLPPNTPYMASPAKEQYRVQSKAGPNWLRKKFGLSHDTKAATTEGVGRFRRSSPQ